MPHQNRQDNMKQRKLIKTIVMLCLSGFFTSTLLSSCEDDAILELETDDECVGSYCRLALPSAEEATIPLEKVANPDEF